MKRIIIICEGPTEKEFCNNVLQPHFISGNIQLQTPLIKKSGGGIVAWQVLKKQIENHLRTDKTAIVTTLIDYYGLKARHEFPDWESAHQNPNKALRMDSLENSMLNDVDPGLRYRFMPYIQLHEFEGLLFSDATVFEKNFLEEEFVNKTEFEEIFDRFPNPEDVNDHPETAPSKRLEKHLKGYNKIVYGAIIAQETGLHTIRAKCSRFNHWLTKLENIK